MKGILKEINKVLDDRFKFVLMFVLPVIITIILTLNFSNGVISNIPIAIVDQDHTQTSRDIVRQFVENDRYEVEFQVNSRDEGMSLIDLEKVEGCIVIPKTFTKDLKNGKDTFVEVIMDSSNMAYSANGMLKASEIIMTYNAGVQIKNLQGQGYLESQAYNIVMPVKFNYVRLNNPSINFIDFLLSGLILAIIQFAVGVLSVEASFERKHGKKNIHEVVEIVAAFTILGVSMTIICFAIESLLVEMTFEGSLMMAFLHAIVFNMAISMIGVMIGSLIKNKVAAIEVMMVVILPALMLSGYSWPEAGFVGIVKVFKYIEPYTYYANPLRLLAFDSLLISEYLFNLGMLSLYVLVCFFVTVRVYNRGDQNDALV